MTNISTPPLASSAKKNAQITTSRESKLVVLLINQKDYERGLLRLIGGLIVSRAFRCFCRWPSNSFCDGAWGASLLMSKVFLNRSVCLAAADFRSAGAAGPCPPGRQKRRRCSGLRYGCSYSLVISSAQNPAQSIAGLCALTMYVFALLAAGFCGVTRRFLSGFWTC